MSQAPIRFGVREAARELGVGRDRMYELAKEGRIRSVVVGTRRLIPRSELEDWPRREIDGGAERDD